MNDFINEPNSSKYGGDWSDQKLSALSKYLVAYTTALKKQPFSLVYIDAFAGGGRFDITAEQGHSSLLFEGEIEDVEAQKQYRHGSPLVALNTNPPFDKFIFIEKNEQSLQRLGNEITQQNYQDKDIECIHGDANEKIAEICDTIDWISHRAVAFIDPFATEVKWQTIEKIASTCAIDLWLLFPAMAVNRMLTVDGKIPPQWQEKLTECFGTDEWQRVFYKDKPQQTLLKEESSITKVSDFFEDLRQFVNHRLESVFPGVSKNNLVLNNSKNSPLFLLCFACSNPKGVGLSLRIANHIIDTSS